MKGAVMYRLKSLQLIVFLLLLFTLCTNTVSLSAQQVEDETAVIVQVEKPISYAQYRRQLDPADLERDFIPVNVVSFPPLPPEKRVLVSLADQQMWVFEGDTILQRFLVSTGTWGHRTPTGNYKVRNQALRAYSVKYDAWMLHWMAITPNGAFGMHSLLGTSYLRKLGSVASHGCIRLSHEDAEWLYNWVDIGTPVEIVDDWEEPPPEKTITYRICKVFCL